MGQAMSCECFEQLQGGDSAAKQERRNKLVKGATFMQSIMLGMSSRKLFVKLSDEGSVIQWKTEPGAWQAEHGEIDLVEVKACTVLGNQGLQFVSNQKVLLELQAEDPSTRDQWIIAVTEILASWEADPSSKPEKGSGLTAAGTSNKAEYFAKREKEMKERQRQREEKKKKYAGTGMKMTAEIMASR